MLDILGPDDAGKVENVPPVDFFVGVSGIALTLYASRALLRLGMIEAQKVDESLSINGGLAALIEEEFARFRNIIVSLLTADFVRVLNF